MNKKTLAIIAALVAAAALAGYAWMRPKAVEVIVVVAGFGDVVSSVANTRAGTVDACRRAGISPAIGGQMALLPVKEGDRVTVGQILVELWNDDRRAEVSLAERDAVATRARRDEVCTRADVAKREGTRLARLLERGLASEEQADVAAGEAKATASGCRAARELIKVADARVDVALARLELTILRAPFDGVIAEINGELGEFVTPSPVGIPTPPTVDLIDGTCLFISAPIDEVDAPAIRPGQKAFISLDAFPERRYSGFVRRVAPYVLDLEKQARTVEIEAEIDDPGDDSLLPGYSADVEVILDTREQVLRVPTQTIIDGEHVLVLDDDVITERPIETGVANWEFTEILSGLEEGELIIVTVDREGVTPGASAVAEK